MTVAFRCDGCLRYSNGEPTLTIEQTDGISSFTDWGTWHACRWACVGEIADKQKGER